MRHACNYSPPPSARRGCDLQACLHPRRAALPTACPPVPALLTAPSALPADWRVHQRRHPRRRHHCPQQRRPGYRPRAHRCASSASFRPSCAALLHSAGASACALPLAVHLSQALPGWCRAALLMHRHCLRACSVRRAHVLRHCAAHAPPMPLYLLPAYSLCLQSTCSSPLRCSCTAHASVLASPCRAQVLLMPRCSCTAHASVLASPMPLYCTASPCRAHVLRHRGAHRRRAPHDCR